MKLLFDQNMPPQLARRLADLYPDSVHVREIGFRDATDNVFLVPTLQRWNEYHDAPASFLNFSRSNAPALE